MKDSIKMHRCVSVNQSLTVSYEETVGMKCQDQYLASIKNIIQLCLLMAVSFIFQDQIRLVSSTVKAGDWYPVL